MGHLVGIDRTTHDRGHRHVRGLLARETGFDLVQDQFHRHRLAAVNARAADDLRLGISVDRGRDFLRQPSDVVELRHDDELDLAAELAELLTVEEYAAVTRQTLTGQPAAGWFPNERISIAEALKAYTYGTAYANFEEKSKGSIAVGKVADLTVLSKNLLQVEPKEFLTTNVIYTIVDGKIVYELSAR